MKSTTGFGFMTVTEVACALAFVSTLYSLRHDFNIAIC